MTAVAIDRENFTMRAPCRCGSTLGRIVEKNGQNTVRCVACSAYCYCAPRTETGHKQRSTTTVHKAIKPAKRARILERDGFRCTWCHHADRPLHVGHILSVDAGLAAGLTDDEINDDENLVASCEECNLGQGALPMPLRVAVAVLRARISWRNKEAAR